MSRYSRGSRDYQDEDGRSLNDYKRLYEEYKTDYKKKKRQCENVHAELEAAQEEAKKARQDTQDLWKIYYALQEELQVSYASAGKLQLEKEELANQLEALKHKVIPGSEGIDPVNLKDALCCMQKQKMDLQSQFNEIVLENKKLREKEATYGPRLAEFDAVQRKLEQTIASTSKLRDDVDVVKHEMRLCRFNRDVVEKFQRWNSFLMMEAEQKSSRLRRLESSSTQGDMMPHLLAMQSELEHLAVIEKQKYDRFHRRLQQLQQSMRTTKLQMTWIRESLMSDMNKAENTLIDDLLRIKHLVDEKLNEERREPCFKISLQKHQAVIDRLNACCRLLTSSSNNNTITPEELTAVNLVMLSKNLESAVSLLGATPLTTSLAGFSSSHFGNWKPPKRKSESPVVVSIDDNENDEKTELEVEAVTQEEPSSTKTDIIVEQTVSDCLDKYDDEVTGRETPEATPSSSELVPDPCALVNISHSAPLSNSIDFAKILSDEPITTSDSLPGLDVSTASVSVPRPVTSDAKRINERLMFDQPVCSSTWKRLDGTVVSDRVATPELNDQPDSKKKREAPLHPNMNRLLPPPEVIELDD